MSKLCHHGNSPFCTKSPRRDTQNRRYLLTLELVAVHHTDGFRDNSLIKTLCHNLFLRFRAFDVLVKNGIENAVVRQAIAVLLVGTQLGGRRLVDGMPWYDFILLVDETRQLVSLRLVDIAMTERPPHQLSDLKRAGRDGWPD